MAMNKRIKKLWVEALRSGKYKQGTGQLRRLDEDTGEMTFCCLGVLCNLHAQENPFVAQEEKNPFTYLGCEGWLPEPVALWAGFKKSEKCWEEMREGLSDDILAINIKLPTPIKIQKTLVDLNDDGTKGFNFIADVIEEQL
jgi:hypothetical protein